MNLDVGEKILAALAEVPGVAHKGWASEVAGEEDITVWCPGAWVQPGGAQQSSEAGRGRVSQVTRIWIVVFTVSGDGRGALEAEIGALVEAGRKRLSGLLLDDSNFRRLRYVSEPEPFYAPGYIECPIEFEANETITGERRHV